MIGKRIVDLMRLDRRPKLVDNEGPFTAKGYAAGQAAPCWYSHAPGVDEKRIAHGARAQARGMTAGEQVGWQGR